MIRLDSRRSILKKSALLTAAGLFVWQRLPALASLDGTTRLGIVADPQYADIEVIGTRHYRQSVWKLAEAVDLFNLHKLAMCVNLGDLIDKNWSSFEAIGQPLSQSKIPFMHVLGNHDFDVLNDEKEKVPAKLGLKDRFFSIESNQWCFVFLDTTDVSLYAQSQENPNSAAARVEMERCAQLGSTSVKPWNGAVSSKQLEWFDKTCQNAAVQQRKVIVFAHHPALPIAEHNAWNSCEITNVVVRNKNVVAWMNGHNHAGDFAMLEGVPFITMQGMVETEKTNAYALLTLLPDRMILEGYGREISREIQFRS